MGRFRYAPCRENRANTGKQLKEPKRANAGRCYRDPVKLAQNGNAKTGKGLEVNRVADPDQQARNGVSQKRREDWKINGSEADSQRKGAALQKGCTVHARQR